MSVQLLKVTLGSGATQIPWSADYDVPWALLCNNAAANMNLGPSTVTSGHGVPLNVGGTFFIPSSAPRGVNLSSWYAIGTSGNVIDIVYEDGLSA